MPYTSNRLPYEESNKQRGVAQGGDNDHLARQGKLDLYIPSIRLRIVPRGARPPVPGEDVPSRGMQFVFCHSVC